MRIEVLSDFLEETQLAADAARTARNAERIATFEAARLEAQRPIAEAAIGVKVAMRRREALTAARWGFAWLWRNIVARRPSAPTLERIGVRDAVRDAGARGEDEVVAVLAQRLDDRWLAFRGFWTPRGNEVDVVLIGPSGVYCIEVKAYVGHIQINGDTWVRTRFDRSGKAVSSPEQMSDRTGQSPSVQLHKAAAPVVRAAGPWPVSTWIVLAGQRVRFNGARDAANQTVDYIATAEHLRLANLDQMQVERLRPDQQRKVECDVRAAHVKKRNRH